MKKVLTVELSFDIEDNVEFEVSDELMRSMQSDCAGLICDALSARKLPSKVESRAERKAIEQYKVTAEGRHSIVAFYTTKAAALARAEYIQNHMPGSVWVLVQKVITDREAQVVLSYKYYEL